VVATGFADFWDGSHAVTMNVAEDGGAPGHSWTWTGSDHSGDLLGGCASFGCGVGPQDDPVSLGFNDQSAANWIEGGLIVGGDNVLVFYALSEEITITEIPEPATMGLMMLGLTGMLCSRRKS